MGPRLAREVRAVLRSVVGVELGHGQTEQRVVSEHDPEGRHRGLEPDADTAPGVLRQRHVGEVDDVDVEVHEEAPATGRGALQGGAGRRRRIGAQCVDADRPQVARGDRGALGRGALLGSGAEEHQVVVDEQRPPRARTGEALVGALDVEHVGDAHPVQRAVGDRARGVEVGVQVEVDQARLGAGRHRAGDRPDTDRAVPAQHHRQLARPQRVLHLRGDGPYAVDHGLGVHRARLAVVDAPAKARRVAAVARAQRLHEAGRPQRLRRVLQPTRERPRARPRAEDRDGRRHRTRAQAPISGGLAATPPVATTSARRRSASVSGSTSDAVARPVASMAGSSDLMVSARTV